MLFLNAALKPMASINAAASVWFQMWDGASRSARLAALHHVRRFVTPESGGVSRLERLIAAVAAVGRTDRIEQ
jgi:hypothetical protein